jgi:hypothetical protein
MMLWSMLSVFFALGAAIFWAWSAVINVPILKSGYGSLVCIMKDGSTEIGESPFYVALKTVSRLNAAAAACAFVSAVAQAVALLSQR